jgi:hypothetical protein
VEEGAPSAKHAEVRRGVPEVRLAISAVGGDLLANVENGIPDNQARINNGTFGPDDADCFSTLRLTRSPKLSDGKLGSCQIPSVKRFVV